MNNQKKNRHLNFETLQIFMEVVLQFNWEEK